MIGMGVEGQAGVGLALIEMELCCAVLWALCSQCVKLSRGELREHEPNKDRGAQLPLGHRG